MPYSAQVEIKTQESCDLCAKLTALREKTADGERLVVCTWCLQVAGVDPKTWDVIHEPETVDKPIDARALAHIQAPVSSPGGEYGRNYQRGGKPCPYPGCTKRSKKKLICFDHAPLLQPAHWKALKASKDKPERHQVYKTIKRYLEIRHRLDELMGADR